MSDSTTVFVEHQDAMVSKSNSVARVLLKLTLKNLVQRPLRYLLTSFAIVFSVAAVSAVFIFTGGLRTTFDQLATNIESGYDISVQPNVQFGDGFVIPTVPLEIADPVSYTHLTLPTKA